MTFDRAMEILKQYNYKVIVHEGWGEYEVLNENGEDVNNGCMDKDELIEYVKSYLME